MTQQLRHSSSSREILREDAGQDATILWSSQVKKEIGGQFKQSGGAVGRPNHDPCGAG